jgi:CMP-N,N'-diacetyllegionaminic acid synthase
MDVLITICARGGSKGIPGKNIKALAGKPLIFYSLQTANEYANLLGNTDIILSTDDLHIKQIVEDFKSQVDTSYNRPDFLASDGAGKIDAIQDVLDYATLKTGKHYDYVIDLDVTSPLRTIMDLQKALSILQESPEAYNIFSVSPANRNPYFNMVEESANGYFYTCKEGAFLTRQSAPKVYDMNASFYIYTSAFFKDGMKKAITEKSLVYEMPHICFDLDHPIDFTIMGLLIENNLLNFELS